MNQFQLNLFFILKIIPLSILVGISLFFVDLYLFGDDLGYALYFLMYFCIALVVVAFMIFTVVSIIFKNKTFSLIFKTFIRMTLLFTMLSVLILHFLTL